jgi:uncharacterized protein YqeY
MKPNRSNNNDLGSASTSRRHRRGEDELIAALKSKIEMLERRKQARTVRQDPTLKLADKLVRALKKAESKFQQSGRLDLANSAKAATISIHQALNHIVPR